MRKEKDIQGMCACTCANALAYTCQREQDCVKCNSLCLIVSVASAVNFKLPTWSSTALKILKRLYLHGQRILVKVNY